MDLMQTERTSCETLINNFQEDGSFDSHLVISFQKSKHNRANKTNRKLKSN